MMKRQLNILPYIFIVIALFFPITAQATEFDLGALGTLTNGDYTITDDNSLASTLLLDNLLSVSGSGTVSNTTSGLTTGTIWDMLNNNSISQAWSLEFALNTNETGSDESLIVDSLSLQIDGLAGSPLMLNTGDSINVSYANGASRIEALFRTDLGFNFMTQYNSGSTNDFILSAGHLLASDGPDIYSLNSVTVTPEPISMALFLIGGTPIAANLYRKRKKFKTIS